MAAVVAVAAFVGVSSSCLCHHSLAGIAVDLVPKVILPTPRLSDPVIPVFIIDVPDAPPNPKGFGANAGLGG